MAVGARWQSALQLISVGLVVDQCQWRLTHAGTSGDLPTVFNVSTFGTIGDGVTDDHDAIQRAFDAARKFGATPTQRAHVVIPRGTYLVKAGLELRANFTTLIIDGQIVLPTDPSAWPMQSDPMGEAGNNTALLRIAATTGVQVTGQGTLYGYGENYWIEPRRPFPAGCDWWHITALPASCAPALLIVNASENFELDGLSFQHPPGGHIGLHGVQNATLRSFVIQSPKIAPDTDGIDSTHVDGLHIYNATINSGDDNVAMKNDTKNVVIEDCVFGHGHGASIGSIPMDGFRGWFGLVSNITMRRVLMNRTDFGVRVKTWQNATGYIKDIVYQDLTLIDVGTAIEVNAFYCQPTYCPGPLKPAVDSCCGANAMAGCTQNVRIDGLKIERVTGSAANKAGSVQCSSGNFGCKNIVMRDVNVQASEGFDCQDASGIARNVTPTMPCLQRQPNIKTDDKFSKMTIMTMYGGTSDQLRGIINVKRGGFNDCENKTLTNVFKYRILLDLANQWGNHTVFDLYKKRLHGDWEAVVAEFIRRARPYVASGTVVGVFIGDEICCSYGVPYSNLSAVASKLKAGLPRAWIHTNECWNIGSWPPLKNDMGGIPPGLDIISADVYDMNTPPERPPNANGTANALKNIAFFEREVFPRLRPHQRALLAPGVFASHPEVCAAHNTSCPLAQQASQVTKRLDILFEWAKGQDKIAGWIPWHFGNRTTRQWGGAYDLELGAVSMPPVVAKLTDIGTFVKHHDNASDSLVNSDRGGPVEQIATNRVNRGCVVDGKANATCFGKFDPEDSTEILQAALNSSASELLIQNVGKPWIVRPLFVNSNNMRIVFEAGTVLLAKRDEFHGSQDSLLKIIGMHNLSIDGNKATFRMRRDDYAVPSRGTCPECKPYTKAEWRMGIFISQSENVTIRNLTVTETGGDGLYIDGYPPGYDGVPKGSANIHVADCILDSNYRQGMSVIGVRNLLVERTIFSGTNGTAPQAGVDLEPDDPHQELTNVTFKDCVSVGNSGSGWQFYLRKFDRSTNPFSIVLDNFTVVSAGTNCFSLWEVPPHVRGVFSITNSRGSHTGSIGSGCVDAACNLQDCRPTDSPRPGTCVVSGGVCPQNLTLTCKAGHA